MNWDELIPELRDWKDPISPGDLAASEGRFPLAIGYLSLFWPSFVEHDGMVFRGEKVDEAHIRSWMTTSEGDKRRVEAVINHFHVLDIQHPGIWKDVTEAQVRFIGETLKEAWAAKLARDYPMKQFVVEFIEGTSEKL
jgi:hypothetical protein